MLISPISLDCFLGCSIIDNLLFASTGENFSIGSVSSSVSVFWVWGSWISGWHEAADEEKEEGEGNESHLINYDWNVWIKYLKG